MMFVLSWMCSALFLTGITGLETIDWLSGVWFIWSECFHGCAHGEWVRMREYGSIPSHSLKKKCYNRKQQTVACHWHCYWQAVVCIAGLCEADIRFKFFSALTSWLWLSENAKTKLYTTVILSFFSYGCEIWSVTWGEDHRPEKFENKLPMNLFWPGRRRRKKKRRRRRMNRRLEKIACERLRESYC